MSIEKSQSAMQMKDHRVVVLGAGSPHRADSAASVAPKQGISSVISWILHSVASLDPDLHFVCGFDDATELRQNRSDIQFWRNEEWADTLSAWSLLKAMGENAGEELNADRRLTAIYSDIIFREESIAKLELDGADIAVAVDSKWLTRYKGRTRDDIYRCEKVSAVDGLVTRLGRDLAANEASSEFVGLVHFGPSAIVLLNDLAKSQPDFLRRANLSDLVEHLRISGLVVRAIDLFGGWAELNDPHDLARFILGTKAQTLLRLKGVLRHGRIEEQVSFSVGIWENNPEAIVERVQAKFSTQRVIVRSSALSEDGFDSSKAGAYDSILNVDASDQMMLMEAIQKVSDSYKQSNPADEILVQPMLRDVVASGVAFSRTLTGGAPYIVVNFDDESGSTDSVTSGTGKSQKTIFLRRDMAMESANTPPMLLPLLRCLREIEKVLNYDSLDVEFAISEEFGLHILQVRPLVTGIEPIATDCDVCTALDSAEGAFTRAQVPSPWLVGSRTIFGIMPDWNPAEIIGKRPDPLAYSIYCDLICDEVWAKQRAEFGYRDIRPQPLLHSFAGHSYVDVRASMNSFVPAVLDDGIANAIVSFCLDWLEQYPELHDKIEFDVIPTCLSLDFSRWQDRLMSQAGLSLQDCAQLREGLRVLTLKGIARVESDLDDIATLERRFKMLRDAPMAPLTKAFSLMEDIKRFGSLPFAHLARNGFVAMTLLRSGVAVGAITNEEMEDFLRSLKTVSHSFTEDALACLSGDLSWERFRDRYGHLRPGTYDITAPSYHEDPESYLRPALERGDTESYGEEVQGGLWGEACPRLASAMAAEGLPIDADELDTFLRGAIEGREYSKFMFTRNLSLAMDLFVDWGGSKGLTRGDLAMLDICDLRAVERGFHKDSTVSDEGALSYLRQKVRVGLQGRALAAAIELPPLLCKPADLHVFQYPSSTPNFVGSKAVMASSVEVRDIQAMPNVDGCIVFIPSADPGYDWLFAQGIAGLITMFGGANSHMAIRASEFDLPAAIGVGPTMYETLVQARDIQLDPHNKIVRVIR